MPSFTSVPIPAPGRRASPRTPSRWLLVAAPLLVLGCHSSGPYGHAKVYSPTSDEDRAVQGHQEYDPLLAQRAPEKQLNRPLWLFGVVTQRSTGANGAAYIAVS